MPVPIYDQLFLGLVAGEQDETAWTAGTVMFARWVGEGGGTEGGGEGGASG